MPIDPDRLAIINYPDPVLRTRAQDVDPADPIVSAVAQRMIDLMHDADGIGLAAPQVGLPWRMFVCRVPTDPDLLDDPDSPPTGSDGPRVYLNPVLSEPAAGLETLDEGCLSLPGISGDVKRPPEITITAIGVNGEPINHRAAGMFARCIQHEFDHLEGTLIIDKMPRMARLKNRSAIRALVREYAEREQ